MSAQHDPVGVWFAYANLTTQYALHVDAADGSGVAELFTPDGKWDAAAFGLGVLTGHAVLTNHFSQVLEQTSVHLVANHLVHDLSGPIVTASSIATAISRRAERVRQLVVRYDDELVFDDTRWLFRSRRLSRLLSI